MSLPIHAGCILFLTDPGLAFRASLSLHATTLSLPNALDRATRQPGIWYMERSRFRWVHTLDFFRGTHAESAEAPHVL